MPNAELLVKEIQSLPPDYMEEALILIKNLKQKAVASCANAPEWQPPPDSDFWEDRVKAGLNPDAWRKSYGAWKDLKFSSEDLFAERRRDVEQDAAEFRATFQKEEAAAK
jgi:hypothetical protein